MENSPKKDRAVAALVLGIIGMLAWLLPIAGLPVQIVGLVFASKSLKLAHRKMAIVAMILCIVGLVLTLINGAWGAYLGATGQHPLFNA